MEHSRHGAALFVAGLLLVSTGASHASCGSAFCLVNTNLSLQGVSTEPGARYDLRYEYINQDQPRSGSDKVGIGQIPRDHDEMKTVNRNWIATFDYTFGPRWGVAVVAPVSDRDHQHIETATGEFERWKFTNLGDVRVLGRYQFDLSKADAPHASFLGLNFGLKLPTGDVGLVNSSGERAERTLQPGTGTTDLLLGAYYRSALPLRDLSWFAQVLAQQPLNSHEDFRPGSRVTADLGVRYDATPKLGLMLQLNALRRGSDSGAQAEPADSGGKYLFLSPGVSYALGSKAQVYAYYQRALYQYVNGVQLTADWSATAGVSFRF